MEKINLEEKNIFINIQSWMVKKLGLKANELIIYALIHGFCQDGNSYFYGSIKYIMENTNLSKETVLTVLQSLVRKKLIIKKDVKSFQVFENKKNAKGSQHFCLYYTAISRNKKMDFTGQESVLVNDNESIYGSNNLTRAGQETLPVAGQNFVPNNLLDNKFKKSTSSDFLNLKNKIQQKLNLLFGYSVSFSPSPIPTFIQNAKISDLSAEEELMEYLEWVFEYLKKRCKEKENFDGYFYKSFTENHLIAKFKNILEQKKSENAEKESMMILCPVCKTKHAKTDDFCKICRFDASFLNDEKEIIKHKNIFAMSQTTKKNYEDELNAIEKEFPLSIRFRNQKMQNEYEEKIFLLEKKFELYKEENSS